MACPNSFHFDLQSSAENLGKRIELTFDQCIGPSKPASPPSSDQHEAINWDDVSAMTATTAGPLNLTLNYHPVTGWQTVQAKTPRWNKALHQADCSGLTLTGDQLLVASWSRSILIHGHLLIASLESSPSNSMAPFNMAS